MLSQKVTAELKITHIAIIERWLTFGTFDIFKITISLLLGRQVHLDLSHVLMIRGNFSALVSTALQKSITCSSIFLMATWGTVKSAGLAQCSAPDWYFCTHTVRRTAQSNARRLLLLCRSQFFHLNNSTTCWRKKPAPIGVHSYVGPPHISSVSDNVCVKRLQHSASGKLCICTLC